MSNKILNIGILSTCSKPGDISGNIEQIEKYAKRSKACGCDVLLTPELSASGYGGYPEVIQTAETAGRGDIYSRIASIAKENKLVMLVGFAEKDGVNVYLSHYIIYPDGKFLIQRKHRVTPLEKPFSCAKELYFDNTEEIGHIEAEHADIVCFEINGVICAIAICADLGIKNLQLHLNKKGVQALFIPVGAGGTRDNKVTNDELKTDNGKEKYISLCDNKYFFPRGSIKDALNHSRAIIAVNMCGFDGKKLYHGGSGSVVNHFGEIVAMVAGIENIDRQRPMFAYGEIDFSESL